MADDPKQAAVGIAEDLLFPHAAEIDSAPVVPRAYLDALAEAGLYGLFGPLDRGGFDADPLTAGRVVEALGGASLVTAFVWIQHHSPVRAMAGAGPTQRDRWLEPLCRGRVRSGIAYAALRRPGAPTAVAAAGPQGSWVVDGHAPWVTGWGLVDVVLAGARAGDDVVWVWLDAVAGPASTVTPVRLDALDASATVRWEWHGLSVPASRVVGIEPFADWQQRDTAGRQLNGYLAVGVAARCARLLGRSGLDDAVRAARSGLDAATPSTVAAARAEASLLAARAATALVAAGGGRSVESGQPAARLLREAMFLLVFGQTRDIRDRQRAALGAQPVD
ncbi:MAG TPA: acyl-CoA dehydrogenase family protein [Acidimicrobiales bacterium]